MILYEAGWVKRLKCTQALNAVTTKCLSEMNSGATHVQDGLGTIPGHCGEGHLDVNGNTVVDAACS